MSSCRRFGVLAFIFGTLATSSAFAGAVNYDFKLTINAVEYSGFAASDCLSYVDMSAAPSFGCEWDPGDTAVGRLQLQVDPESLGDGIHSFLPLSSWAIRRGEIEWDMNLATSEFAGFRDGAYCGAAGTGFSQINPGLRVSQGVLSGFCGGVFGRGDVPFIDFDHGAGMGQFSALDLGGIRLSGTYAMNGIPEPSTIVLVGLALGLLSAARRSAGFV